MKRYERDILIERPINTVFDYFADMTNTAKWAPEDFVSVTRQDDGPLDAGSRFAFVTTGAKAKSVFHWTIFTRPTDLEFYGPKLEVGPGWWRVAVDIAFRKWRVAPPSPRGTSPSSADCWR